MTERTAEDLNEISKAITQTIYAWQAGIVEHLRNAADVLEQQLLNGGPE